MTEFTKGPWRVREDVRVDHGIEYIAGLDIISDDYEIVACEGIASNSDINIANAHLIAAAPELYEALEKIVTAAIDYDDANSLCSLGESLMPILAKARGEA